MSAARKQETRSIHGTRATDADRAAALRREIDRAGVVEDALSQALSRVRLSAWVAPTSELHGTWGIELPGGPGGMYCVVAGRMLVECAVSRESIDLRAGDIAIIARGDPHTIRSDASAQVRSVFDVVSPEEARSRRGVRIGADNGQAATRLLGASFRFSGRGVQPLVSGLPRLMVVRKSEQSDAMMRTVHILETVAGDRSPGAQTLVGHLVSILFVEAVRRYAQTAGTTGAAVFAALLDPAIGPVLGLMHARPEEGWTLEQLANEAGLSRSVFHERFGELVGCPPLTHLRECRMQRGAELLTTTEDDVKHIAHQTGYASEGAFGSAFKRWSGKTPQEFRTSR